jgi:hypothetical protein
VQRYRAEHPEVKSYEEALRAVLAADVVLARDYATWDPSNPRRWPIIDASTIEHVPSQAETAIDRGEAGAEVHRLALKIMAANRGMDYADALTQVLKDHPDLARRYRVTFNNQVVKFKG